MITPGVRQGKIPSHVDTQPHHLASRARSIYEQCTAAKAVRLAPKGAFARSISARLEQMKFTGTHSRLGTAGHGKFSEDMFDVAFGRVKADD